MTGFKEQLRKDTENIFFNTDEFADETTWNGIPIPIIWQEGRVIGSPEMGIYEVVDVCFVPVHLVEKPFPEQVINLGGIERTVREATSDPSVHEVEIYRIKSR